MRAAILEGDKLARLNPKEDDRLAEKCPPTQLPPELVRKSGRVPAIGKKHYHLRDLWGHYRCWIMMRGASASRLSPPSCFDDLEREIEMRAAPLSGLRASGA